MTERQRQGPLPHEADYVRRASQGDKEAYRYLVEGLQDRLYSRVLSMVHNPQLAEDLTQEIFVKAFFALPKFQGGSAFYTWLFRIGSNHCLDHLRIRKAPEISLDAPLDPTENHTLADRIEAPPSEHADALPVMPTEVGAALAALSPEQRQILTMRELEGYTYEELADFQQCNMNTVKTRLRRAREALLAAFQQRTGNIPSREDVQPQGDPSI